MKKKLIVSVVLLLLVSVAVWWWIGQSSKDVAPVYRTEALTVGEVRSKVTATGTLQAVTEVLVGSQISGNIDQVYVGYNSKVKKGELLAQLDPSTYETQVNQAAASVSSAQATLENVRADLGNASANVKSAEAAIVNAEAKVQQAQAGVLSARSSLLSAQARLEKARSNFDNAELNRDRNRQLNERDLIARSELDTAETAYLGARADVASAEADVESAKASLTSAETMVTAALSDVEAARIKRDASLDLLSGAQARIVGNQAQVAQAQANLESAKINLQRTSITSPIDGIVLDIAVTAGQTVAAQFQAPDLFTLARNLDQMQVETSVDEADVGRVKVGVRASFTVDAFPDEKFQGTVTEVRQSPIVTSNVVTYIVIIDTTNENLLLKPGMTATVEIYDEERDGVFIVSNEALRYKPSSSQGKASSSQGKPNSSRGERGQEPSGDSLYILKNGKLERHEVTVGVTDGLISEISGHDLSEGTEIVLGEGTRGTANNGSNSTRRSPRMRMF